MNVAILATTILDRAHLLARSLPTWEADLAASGLTGRVCLASEGFHDSRADCSWQDLSGSNYRGYNALVESVDAEVYIFTHPEVMFAPGTVLEAYERAREGVWAGFRVYWLPAHMTRHLDDYAPPLEAHDDLYRHDPNDHGPFYWNVNVPAITDWQSNTTYALSKATAGAFFPMPLFGHWGPDDPYQAHVRAHKGIPCVTCESILYHQWHPASEHPSDEQICREASEAL